MGCVDVVFSINITQRGLVFFFTVSSLQVPTNLPEKFCLVFVLPIGKLKTKLLVRILEVELTSFK